MHGFRLTWDQLSLESVWISMFFSTSKMMTRVCSFSVQEKTSLYCQKSRIPHKEDGANFLCNLEPLGVVSSLSKCNGTMESDSVDALQSYRFCCNHTAFPPSLPEVPSAPFISEVRPFSTSAQVQFAEPDSTGGVPVLKYKAEWRTQGRGSWAQEVYLVEDGENVRCKQK